MDNIISKIIGERINSLLAVQNKKQKELAEVLGVTDNTISYFCSGKRIPNTGQIKKIAEFFHCSTDYLFGLSDSATTDKDMQFICDYTGLSEEAISYLRYFVQIWKQAYPPRKMLSILNQFISSGMLALLVEAMADYYGELSYATNLIESAVCTLKDEYNEKDGSHLLDVFTISNFTKEMRLYSFDMSNLANAFMQKYASEEFEDYHKAVVSFNEANRKNSEYNAKVKQKGEGETHGDDQEA